MASEAIKLKGYVQLVLLPTKLTLEPTLITFVLILPRRLTVRLRSSVT